MDTNVRRGDIFYADLSPVVGSEQGGTRPVLIIQNDMGNRHSPTVIAAAITSQTGKARLPTHISLSGRSVGLSKDSIVLLEQVRTIDKRRLREHMGHVDDALMNQVDNAIAVSFGLNG
ncbi:MAG: type II toxin-antitoxin system PemK/MazF family toxin [Ruminococcaceae bacterium]|jgi:Growth inhibitor|nr:type II toxin-antitoxin system PemK/MazF family toxin [Oscillospiraceae bacterium]